ncbi:hypothetical protein T492DRAFT_885520 [Pavlovales sp. CCMP2436]|nr:hypothetical protein T492DRAFT_885520 [Pavlovales sp. CCMP2436]
MWELLLCALVAAASDDGLPAALSAGAFNVTASSLKQRLATHKGALLLGFSSADCRFCRSYEAGYYLYASSEPPVPLARVDAELLIELSDRLRRLSESESHTLNQLGEEVADVRRMLSEAQPEQFSRALMVATRVLPGLPTCELYHCFKGDPSCSMPAPSSLCYEWSSDVGSACARPACAVADTKLSLDEMLPALRCVWA